MINTTKSLEELESYLDKKVADLYLSRRKLKEALSNVADEIEVMQKRQHVVQVLLGSHIKPPKELRSWNSLDVSNSLVTVLNNTPLGDHLPQQLFQLIVRKEIIPGRFRGVGISKLIELGRVLGLDYIAKSSRTLINVKTGELVPMFDCYKAGVME